VTLMPETGLESKADGLLPGTLFDAIYFDHEDDFVVLNPTPPSPRAPERTEASSALPTSHSRTAMLAKATDVRADVFSIKQKAKHPEPMRRVPLLRRARISPPTVSYRRPRSKRLRVRPGNARDLR